MDQTGRRWQCIRRIIEFLQRIQSGDKEAQSVLQHCVRLNKGLLMIYWQNAVFCSSCLCFTVRNLNCKSRDYSWQFCWNERVTPSRLSQKSLGWPWAYVVSKHILSSWSSITGITVIASAAVVDSTVTDAAWTTKQSDKGFIGWYTHVAQWQLWKFSF